MSSSGKISFTTTAQRRKVVKWMKVVSADGNGPGPRWGHTFTAVGDGKFIYAFGGYKKDRCRTNQVHIFDADNLCWKEPEIKGNPPSPRNSHSCTAVGDYLFVFGGTDGTKPLNDLHFLNTKTHCWTEPTVRGTKPEPREGHGAAYVDEKFFIFGGCGKSENGDIYYNDLYILDADFTWMRVVATPTSPSKRVSHTCSSWNHEIIVIGGEDSSNNLLSDVHVLNPENLTWRELKTTRDLFPPRAGHTTIRLGKYMIVFGGFSDEQQLYDDIHVLNMENVTWTKLMTTGLRPSGRFSVAGDCVASMKVQGGGGGILAFFGGCNKKLEPLGDMYCLNTGLSRRAEQINKKSLRKQLELKSQVQPPFMSRYEMASVEVEHVQDTTTCQPMPISTSIPPDSQNQYSSEVLPSGKRVFQVIATNSFTNGYNIEAVIDGMPFHGVLYSNEPISPSMGADIDNRKFKRMKTTVGVSGNPHFGPSTYSAPTLDVVMQASDAQEEPKGSEAVPEDPVLQMEDPTATGFSMPQ